MYHHRTHLWLVSSLLVSTSRRSFLTTSSAFTIKPNLLQSSVNPSPHINTIMTMSTSSTTNNGNKKQKMVDPNEKGSQNVRAALFENDELWDTTKWKETNGEKTLRKRMDAHIPEFILYSSWFCPFAQRAWITAEYSGVSYKIQEINPYYVEPDQPGGYSKKAMTIDEKRQLYPEFVETSPRGLVPAIRVPSAINNDDDDDDILLWESLPVAEYIDAVFNNSGKKLIDRTNPYHVAKQQIWCNHCTDRIQKKYYQALVAQDLQVQKEATIEFYKECRMLANAMSTNGPFFDGHDLTMVDVALAPFWQRILSVGPYYFNLKLPEEEPEFQRLQVWWKACQNHPAIAATIVCEPRLISSYSDYSKNVATSDAAKNYFK